MGSPTHGRAVKFARKYCLVSSFICSGEEHQAEEETSETARPRAVKVTEKDRLSNWLQQQRHPMETKKDLAGAAREVETKSETRSQRQSLAESSESRRGSSNGRDEAVAGSRTTGKGVEKLMLRKLPHAGRNSATGRIRGSDEGPAPAAQRTRKGDTEIVPRSGEGGPNNRSAAVRGETPTSWTLDTPASDGGRRA